MMARLNSAATAPTLEPRVSTYIGLFFVALATLMYEILLTRIFSVTMLYHFAFVALSLAMFGHDRGRADRLPARRGCFTPARSTESAGRSPRVAFPIAMVLSFLTELSIPFRVASVGRRDLRDRLHLRRDRRAVRRQRHRRLPGADRLFRHVSAGCTPRISRARRSAACCSSACSTGPTGRRRCCGSRCWRASAESRFAVDARLDERLRHDRHRVASSLLGAASAASDTRSSSGEALPDLPHPVHRRASFEARAALREVELVLARARQWATRAPGAAAGLGAEPDACRRTCACASCRWTSTSSPGTVMTGLRRRLRRPSQHLRYDVTNIGYYLRHRLRRARDRRRRRARRAVGAGVRRAIGDRGRDQQGHHRAR